MTPLRSIVTAKFRSMLEKLPPHIQQQARAGFATWKSNPALVGWKKLKGMQQDAEIFSVDIGLRYRAIGVVSKQHAAVVWLFVGSHETYNNFIKLRREMTQDKWLNTSMLARLEHQRAGKKKGPCGPNSSLSQDR